jgi:hypothetical protein
MDGWAVARRVLLGQATYVPCPLGKLAPVGLPANERRRATATIRLALHTAEQAVAPDTPTGASVFATASGDLEMAHRICQALTEPDRPVSPTQFHNSVHNAAAGYWAIMRQDRSASTTVSAGEGSFAAGLLEAAIQVVVERRSVLLVAYDHPAPAPLAGSCPITTVFACALQLRPAPGADLELALLPSLPRTIDTLTEPALERLRTAAPAAAALPLLRALAHRESATVSLPWLADAHLGVALRP